MQRKPAHLPPHEEMRPREHGMTELLREPPFPPVVYEPLEKQSLRSPEGVHVVLKERQEILLEPDTKRAPLELAFEQAAQVPDVDAGELENDPRLRDGDDYP